MIVETGCWEHRDSLYSSLYFCIYLKCSIMKIFLYQNKLYKNTRGTSLQTRLKLQRWQSRKTEKIWILDDVLSQNHSSKEYTLPLKVFLCEVINCCIFKAFVRLGFWYLRPKESKLFSCNHSRGLYIWTRKWDWTIEEWHIFINEYRWMEAIHMTFKNDIFVAYAWEEK